MRTQERGVAVGEPTPVEDQMHIALIAGLRHGLREPMAGGLERHTADLAATLRARGHQVTVFASADADPDLAVEPICPRESLLDLSPGSRRDVSMLSERFMIEHDAYLGLMLRLADSPFDVIHDNSIHYLPPAMAAMTSRPLIKVLHTPPTPWLESALRHARDSVTVVSVSPTNARSWSLRIDAVVPNGVDLDVFRPGPGGGPALWSGRLVPEKAPHLALLAAHAADTELDVVGPVGDQAYVDQKVTPLLDGRRRLLGHLRREDLATRLRHSSVAVATPMWEEPYGLVVAEALGCGTPVAGFASGALPWILDEDSGVLVESGDVDALADAIGRAARLDRRACRRRAESVASLETMREAYLDVYRAALR